MDKVVELTQAEYQELLHAREVLQALYAAGVDNWEGYADAMEMLNES